MTIQPIFEQTGIRERRRVSAQSIVECKAFRSADEVKKILSVSARAETVGAETVEREVRYSGRVVYDIVYLDAEGALRRTEVGAEFSHKAESADASAACTARVVLTLDRTEVRPVNGSLVATSVATADITLSRVTPSAYLTGGEGLISRREEREIVRSLPCAGALTVSDEWECSVAVKSILTPSASVGVTAVSAGIGCIVCDGEITLFLLAEDGEGKPFADCRRIPFRLETECADAMPGMAADADVRVKDIRINANVDPDRNATSVEADVVLDLSGEVYSVALCEVAADAYSPTAEIFLTRGELCCDRPAGKRAFELTAGGKAGVSGAAAGAVTATLPLSVNAAVTEVREGGATVEGVLSACAFVWGESADAVTLELPFSFALDAEEIRAGDEVRADVSVVSLSARTLGETEAEMKADLRVTLSSVRKERVSVIVDAAEGEAKTLSDAAISVYLPRPGNTLWDVGKELGVSPEDIMEFNKDLQFPLTGEERIVVYRRAVAQF